MDRRIGESSKLHASLKAHVSGCTVVTLHVVWYRCIHFNMNSVFLFRGNSTWLAYACNNQSMIISAGQ